nr:MAG TPA: hypothetical protein [Caudoviricetes sp.]
MVGGNCHGFPPLNMIFYLNIKVMPRMALQCWLPPHPALNTKIHQSQWCMFCKAFWRIIWVSYFGVGRKINSLIFYITYY